MGRFLLQLCVCVFLAASFVEGTKFYMQPKVFYEDDVNVKLICTLANETVGDIMKVFRLKIEKNVLGDKWALQAVIDYDEKVRTTSKDFTAAGYVGTAPESYLIITWPHAVKSSFGSYRCTASAEAHTGDFISRVSQKLAMVGKSRDTHNLFDLLRGGVSDLMDEIAVVKTRTYESETSMDEHFKNAVAVRGQVLDILVKLQNEVALDVLKKLDDLLARLTRVEEAVVVKTTPTSKR